MIELCSILLEIKSRLVNKPLQINRPRLQEEKSWKIFFGRFSPPLHNTQAL